MSLHPSTTAPPPPPTPAESTARNGHHTEVVHGACGKPVATGHCPQRGTGCGRTGLPCNTTHWRHWGVSFFPDHYCSTVTLQDLDTFLEAFPLVLGDDPAAYTLDLPAMSGEDGHDGSYFTGGSTVATSTHGSAATTLAAAAVDLVSARGVPTQ